MAKLNGLKPLNVFKYFEEICSIPHGSENMDAISEYCVKFAEDHSLKCIRDDANNVIVFKPATKGYESAEYTWNKKNVKITLRALSYDLYLAKTGIATISAICETFESEDYPYVVNLGEYEADFSYVTLLVNKKKFDKADNVDDLFTHVSNCCAYYLLQDNDSPKEYKIDICDEKTGELLDSRTYNKKDFLS